MSESKRQRVGNLDIEPIRLTNQAVKTWAVMAEADGHELLAETLRASEAATDSMIVEIVWLRELRALFNNHARELTFAEPHKNIRALLYTRRDLKACRGFIEGVASGRFRPTMEDARKFLAGVDAQTKGTKGDAQ